MKVAELEAHHEALTDSEQTICGMVEKREFPAVFLICTESFQHIVPAINYRKKRDIAPVVPNFMAFTTICKYAPILFEHEVIESLFEFIKSVRILSQSENNFLDSIEAAKKRELVAYTLWNHLEKHPGMVQRNLGKELGVAQKDAVSIVVLWEELGILTRQMEDRRYKLNFRTLLDQEIMGICPNCGVRGRGQKEAFFRLVTCQKCGVEGYYHMEYDLQ